MCERVVGKARAGALVISEVDGEEEEEGRGVDDVALEEGEGAI